MVSSTLLTMKNGEICSIVARAITIRNGKFRVPAPAADFDGKRLFCGVALVCEYTLFTRIRVVLTGNSLECYAHRTSGFHVYLLARSAENLHGQAQHNNSGPLVPKRGLRARPELGTRFAALAGDAGTPNSPCGNEKNQQALHRRSFHL